jgi:hypothetical protein
MTSSLVVYCNVGKHHERIYGPSQSTQVHQFCSCGCRFLATAATVTPGFLVSLSNQAGGKLKVSELRVLCTHSYTSGRHTFLSPFHLNKLVSLDLRCFVRSDDDSAPLSHTVFQPSFSLLGMDRIRFVMLTSALCLVRKQVRKGHSNVLN